MPIYGFLKIKDPGRISTITSTLDRNSQVNRKQIWPLLPGKSTGRSVDQLSSRIYTQDCLRHDPGGVVIPVILMQYVQAKGWEQLGKASVCPFCWVIVRQDLGLPPPVVQDISYEPKPRKKAPRKQAKVPGHVKQQEISHENALERFLSLLETMEPDPFTLDDVIKHCKYQKTAALRKIHSAIELGKISVVKQGGGQGVKTIYRKEKLLKRD